MSYGAEASILSDAFYRSDFWALFHLDYTVLGQSVNYTARILQALLDDIGPVNAFLTAEHDLVADAYDALIAMIVLCCSSGLMILVLFGLAAMFQSRPVLNYSLMTLPFSGLVIWCTAAVVYGMWIIASDACTLTDVHSASAIGSNLHVNAQNAIFPCPNATAALSLSHNSKKTHLALSKAVNQLVTGVRLPPNMHLYRKISRI